MASQVYWNVGGNSTKIRTGISLCSQPLPCWMEKAVYQIHHLDVMVLRFYNNQGATDTAFINHQRLSHLLTSGSALTNSRTFIRYDLVCFVLCMPLCLSLSSYNWHFLTCQCFALLFSTITSLGLPLLWGCGRTN